MVSVVQPLNVLWNKIWRDMSLYRSRTLLAIASLAAGVFCVGTLFGMTDLQLRKMDAAHRLSHPSHINLMLRSDADNQLRDQLTGIGGVLGIDLLTQLTVRFKLAGDSEWRMGTLIVRPDYDGQLYDLTTLQSGAWPASERIAVERLSAKAAGLENGSQVVFETVNGPRLLPIGGIVRHPFVKPPRFGGQLHFFADRNTAALFGVPKNTFRQVLAQIKPPYSADRAREVARELRNVLRVHGIATNATLLQDPEQHWGRPFFAGVNRVLQIMALASLALASVLVFNTVSAHIAQQGDQIGVMKALGGRKAVIAAVYLSETLFTAALAVALAAPASLAAAYIFSCRLLELFNIDCGAFDYSVCALALMLAGGLSMPLVAALGPILRGTRITVREALASYGLGTDFGRNRFDLHMERFAARRLPTLYAAALGNLLRRKARLLWTQSVLVIAGVMFLTLAALIASVNLTLDNEIARSRYALRLGFSSDQSGQQIVALAKTLLATGETEIWRRLPVELARLGSPLRHKGSLGAQLIALPAGTAMYRPRIETGRWLQAGDAGRRVLVLSADTAALNGVSSGDTLEVKLGPISQSWQVIGTYRWLAGNNFSIEPVYAPLPTIQDISGDRDRASFLLVDAPLADVDVEAAYLRSLKRIFEDRGIQLDVYSTQAKLEQRQFARNQFQPVIATLFGLAAMIAAVGGIGLAGALAIGVLQRVREIGVLRAVGSPSKAVFRLFQLEGLLHGGIAWMISVPPAYFASEPLAEQLGTILFGIRLDYAFNWRAVGIWLAIMLLLAWIASYWPARKAARLTIRECLGH